MTTLCDQRQSSTQFVKAGDRSPQWEKLLRRIVTFRESGMRTDDLKRVPRAVTTRS